MDKHNFMFRFNEEKPLSAEDETAMIRQLVASSPKETDCPSSRVLVIAMEELAELTQEVSKAYRGKLDRMNLLQEMGDVMIAIESLQQIFDISKDELDRARAVKLHRNLDRAKQEDNQFR